MATLSDYINHPEKITNEEREEFIQMIKIVEEMRKASECYHFDINKNNNSHRVASNFYQEHLVRAAILEAFIDSEEISYKELNKFIFNYVPNEFIWDVPVNVIQCIIAKMIRLGFVIPIDTGDKYMPKFRITEDGIKILQQHTFQNLASSSFFNYQTNLINERSISLNKKSLYMNILMLIVTIASVIVTILTIYLNH